MGERCDGSTKIRPTAAVAAVVVATVAITDCGQFRVRATQPELARARASQYGAFAPRVVAGDVIRTPGPESESDSVGIAVPAQRTA